MEPHIILLFVLSFIVNFLTFTFVLPAVIETHKRYSRGKLVVCPERNQEATILFSPNIAAATSIVLPTEIRIVKACSLLSGKLHCTRACAAQVH